MNRHKKLWILLLLIGSAVCLGRSTSAGSITGTVSGFTARDKGKVLVYIKEAPGNYPAPAKPVVMDQKGMVFIPFLLPVLQGQTVSFLNSDPQRHNVFSPSGEKYNLGTWPSGETKSYTFKNLGVYEQLCNIHPEMQAFILVLQNPYHTESGPNGTFTLSGIKDGTYTLVAWHPVKKFHEVQVTVAGGKAAPVTIGTH